MKMVGTGILAATLALASVSIRAAIVQLDGVIATGILDLEVEDRIYDVSFVENSFNALNVDNNHAFLGDEMGANLAVDLINALLTEARAERTATWEWAHFLIPFSFTDTHNEAYVGTNECPRCVPVGGWVNLGHGGTWNDGARTVYATFSTPNPVPILAPVWLLSTGVLGLLGFRWFRHE